MHGLGSKTYPQGSAACWDPTPQLVDLDLPSGFALAFTPNRLSLVTLNCSSQFTWHRKLEFGVVAKHLELLPRLPMVEGCDDLLTANCFDGITGPGFNNGWWNAMLQQLSCEGFNQVTWWPIASANSPI
jgi:hypothetical protein